MGMAAILVMWPEPFEQMFGSLILRSFHMKCEFNWPSGFKREDVLYMLTEDGRRTP